ncbi:fumarylacetoacetate hydrolase family protein [Chitinasiproducens palmae]|uniref:2-keto-4-pentenoate hydratase n=1 Tax=Chitinasiproducens palmae TaxID=1770053 RepID=A0A1H2PVD5_9BURK|nr:fumarylacetoacetate hydrolase family protein [Chitinasiproducens palmae]SDV51218.1 2-keto-4-pentenoate hydratase [Chitinasiproducens palmae]
MQDAASLLIDSRRSATPLDRLPDDLRPTDAAAAFAIQKQVTETLGDAVAGWKCAVPAGEKLIAAPIFASGLVDLTAAPGAEIPVAGALACVEPELAFILKEDLPARAQPYSRDEIRAAIGSVRLALEIIASRFADPSACSQLELLADGMFNDGLVLGPVVEDAFAQDLDGFALVVESGTTLRHDGRHPSGDALAPLEWLANNAALTGANLRAGQAIITGSYAGMLDFACGTPHRLAYGALGEFEVRFARRDADAA